MRMECTLYRVYKWIVFDDAGEILGEFDTEDDALDCIDNAGGVLEDIEVEYLEA